MRFVYYVKKVAIGLLVFSSFALAACQPTPKLNTGALENVGVAPTFYEQEVALYDGIQLVISASVIAPDGPFVQASIERQTIDASFVEKIAQTFSVNSVFYKCCETSPELTLAIMTYERQLESVRSKLPESEIQYIEGIIENMKRALASTPETEPVVSLDQVMEREDAKIDTGHEKKAVLVFSRGERRNFIRITNNRWKDVMFDDVAPLQITEEDALRQATDILRKLGISDEFSLVATRTISDEYTLVVRAMNQLGLADYPYDHRIKLIFMRDIYGKKQVYSEQIAEGTWRSEYADMIFWEMIEMEFDNDGLALFNWQEPGSVTIDSSESQIIDLETAVDAMCEYMTVSQNQYSYNALGFSPKNITIHIDRIELGMSCIMGENRTILVVPVWEFYGNVEYIDSSGKARYVKIDGLNAGQTSDEPFEYYSLCTINALTGKRIDRGLGY